MRRKILIVFGTRPEAIKMAPLIKEFQKFPGEFDLKVCITAQHREMLDQVLSIFEITPDYDLNIMKPDQGLHDITSTILLKIKNVLDDFHPDMVFVQGDTTTTFSTALASFYQKIPVGHIEAGLRTGNIHSPWPEEMNRKLTSSIAKFHFAPTETSKQNLLKEGINEENIHVTGNTVIDALYLALNKIRENKVLRTQLEDKIARSGYQNISRITDHGSRESHPERSLRVILVTGHRRENFGQGFVNICHALKEIAIKHSEIDIVYPVHLNPNVQKPVYNILSKIKNIYLIEPLEYLPFVYLMDKCYLVLTDSGGIQEEAPGLGKPVLVMRNTTERPEAVDAGTVILVGVDKEKIVNEVSKLLDNKSHYEKMSKAHNPYGDGEAAKRIVAFLKSRKKSLHS